MNEVISRGTPDHQWREPAPLSNRAPQFGPVAVVRTTTNSPRGVQTAVQQFRTLDGSMQRRDLPEQTEPGQWRETVENGRRLLVFARRDGSRSVVCLD